jgi:hypothetical protein
LPLQRRAVRLRGAAAKVFNVETIHPLILTKRETPVRGVATQPCKLPRNRRGVSSPPICSSFMV